MAAGDIYQIKLFTDVLGKECLNVFHFEQQAGGSIPGDLGATVNDAFWASINGDLRALIHPANTVLRSELVVLGFPEIWNIKTINAAGQWSDVDERGPAQRNQCVGFRYQRRAVGQHHGFKRFSGMSADAIEDGVWSSTLVPLALELELKLEAGFEAGTTLFQPFVASRPIVIGTNPNGYVPLGVAFYQNSTQNTRK